MTGDFDLVVNGQRVAFGDTYYKNPEWGGDRPLMAPDVVEQIRQADPLYEPCADLNGPARFVKPKSILRSAHVQSMMIIQPINFEADGRQDMCDSCPDITVPRK